MESLRKNDWMRLHEFLLALHSVPALEKLPNCILTGMRQVFPFDSASIQDDRGGLRRLPWLYENQNWEPASNSNEDIGLRMMTNYDPPFHLLREAFFAASAEKHPHTDYYLRTGDGAARRLSEIVPMQKLRRTIFFNEISRRNGLGRQLTIYMPLPSSQTLTFAACRQVFDFSERERQMLELLRGHITMAWTRALATQRQRQRIKEMTGSRPPLEDEQACVQILRRLGLSAREAEVLLWVTHGKTNREIGTILGLTPLTVKFYVGRLLGKLGCETRTAAARTAIEAVQDHA